MPTEATSAILHGVMNILLASWLYAGFNLTKVAVFSDDMYGAVGGNFTCNVYVGGTTPAAGTLASTITVDVTPNLGAWCEYDLTTPVNVSGSDPIWVIWTVNSYGSSLGYPAGCASHTSSYGDWWNPGDGSGWEHMGDCTWTMKNYFTNGAGRSVVLGTADAAPMAVAQNTLSSNLRSHVKGEARTAECINPNPVLVPMTSANNNRAFSHYRVYRTNCYNDGPYTEENTVVLACELHDTVYIDVSWPDAAPGVYKWGVGCVYVGNRGEEVESPITWGAPQAINNSRSGSFAAKNGTVAGSHTGTPVATNRDGWMYYDDGVNLDAIGLTSGGSFYWGVMFPGGSYTGNQLTKVSMYDNEAHTGTILVYQGGDTAPGTLLYSQPYTCTGSSDFVEWTMSTPVTIDPTEPLDCDEQQQWPVCGFCLRRHGQS
jgi:hypothetical protein